MDKKQAIIEKLQEVYDPELPVNIYDLGLIYAIEFDEDDNCTITMTLTTPLCPVAGEMPGQVTKAAASALQGGSVHVDLVFDPPWDTDKMTEEGRAILSQHGFPI